MMQTSSVQAVLRKLSILTVIAVLISIILMNARWIMFSEGLHDFGSFFASGLFASEGNNPYSSDSPYIFFVEFRDINVSGLAPNLNPPITVALFQLMSQSKPNDLLKAWRVGIVIFYFISIIFLLKSSNIDKETKAFRFIWALSLAGFWHTIQLGQLYTLLLFLTVIVYYLLGQKRTVIAGIFLGILIAIKPNFVFWAFALAVTGNWAVFLSAGATSLVISIIPISLYGFNIYRQWLAASMLYTPDLLLFPGNNSLQGLFAHFSKPELGLGLGVILAVSVLINLYNKRSDYHTSNTIGIITSLLISPIAWTGYTLLLIPSLITRQKWKWMDKIAASIFSIPFLVVLTQFQLSFNNFVFWGWFYGWGLLALLSGEYLSTIKELQ